ncbi:unnamed protein product [Rhizopus microsporus]
MSCILDHPVIVSIDFGTTFSGCCYCLAQNSDVDINAITKWPKYNGFYAKVPTCLYYKNKNKVLGWGKGAKLLALKPNQEGVFLQYFKLALVQNDIPLPDGKTAYICEEIQKTRGFQNYRQDQYQYCLTVPAIWSDEAKALMRQAAIRAGMITADDPLERLKLISEPEAAAAYCENRYNSLSLKNGDVFMIVDAGGGTIDLVTYQIEDIKPPRKLKEVTKGHGGMCGSAFIDQNMRFLLRTKLGSNIEKVSACMYETMMDNFIERIKPNYRGDEDQYTLEVPAAVSQYIPAHFLNDNGHMIFDKDELEDYVFGPVLDQVIDLIKEQLIQAGCFVNSIFLVGGFGSSSYLYEAIKNHLGPDEVGEIAMPPRGELAVAEGAIYHVLGPTLVTSKILRRSYGIRTRLPFAEGIDPESSAIITSDGIKRCSTRFEVIAMKGARIDANQTMRRTYWVEYPKHTEVDLYACDDDSIPRYITDKGVVKLIELPVKMPLLSNVENGTRVDVTVSFIFGLTEIKIVTTIAGITAEHVLDANDFYT